MTVRFVRFICLILGLVGLALPGFFSNPSSADDAPATQPQLEYSATPVAPVPTTAPVGLSNLPTGARIAVITIQGEIYGYTVQSVQRRIDRALAAGATLVVFEIDSTGGYIDSAIKLSEEIKDVPKPTVAWINHDALSGGAVICASANETLVAPVASVGDCPVIRDDMMAGLSPHDFASLMSPLLSDLRDSTGRSGVNFELYHAMAVRGVMLYEVSNPLTGETRIVNQADYDVMVKNADPEQLRQNARAAIPAPAANSILPNPSVEELGGVNPSQPDSERGKWKLVRQIHDGSTVLTLNQSDALKLGLARGTVRNDAELQQFYHAASLIRVDETWSEILAIWLSKPIARAILLILFLGAVLVEAVHPGVGVITVGAVAFVLLLAPPYIIGLAEIWHFVLIFVGIVLILLEIFVYPTVGAMLIAGLILVFAGFVLMVVPAPGSGMGLPTAVMRDRLLESTLWTFIGFIASVFVAIYFSTQLRQLPFFRRLILANPEPMPAFAGPAVSGEEALGNGTIQVGDTGTASSGLRPSGRALIRDQLIDVVTKGGFIPPGNAVRVVEIAGNRIVVESVE